MSRLFEATQKCGGMARVVNAIIGDTAAAEAPGLQPETPEVAPEGAAAAVATEPPLAGSSTWPTLEFLAAEPLVPAPAMLETEAPAAPETAAPPFRVANLQRPERSPVLPFDAAHWHASEQYRLIRTKILQHPKSPRMIVVSSAGPGDGKSITSINIAGALSLKTEIRVLLVDADFRRSSIHRWLGIPAGPGLADILHNRAKLQEALVRLAEFPNLYVMPCGDVIVNPTELLDSTNWNSVAQTLRNSFDVVVIDSPPIGAVADYDLLQATVDAVVAVVRPDHTNRRACMKALATIPKDRFLGVVLNCASDWIFAAHYGYSDAYYRRTVGG